MANLTQLEILGQGVKIWNEWRRKNIDFEVNLGEVVLRGAVLRGANLRGAELSDADLSDADLRGADLNGADLRRADLSDADLRGAELNGADLRGADLRGAELSVADLSSAAQFGADLRDADLSDADLRDADLSDVDLRGADLSGVDLRGAELDHAICGRTIFADSDLAAVKGLETIRHFAPSTIDVDTLFRSRSRLPDIFLRGCGVPEILIEYLPFMHEKAIDFYSCFISYSHADKAFARRLHDTLQGQGIRCWLDEKQINPGEVIEDEIFKGIRYSDKLLLCCSKDSLKSWWVDNELDNLFEKERQLQKERGETYRLLIPLDIDGYLHSDEYQSGKKAQIRKRFAPSFKGYKRKDEIFEREVERVIKALRTDGGKEPPPKPKL